MVWPTLACSGLSSINSRGSSNRSGRSCPRSTWNCRSPIWPPQIANSDPHVVWPEAYQNEDGYWVYPAPLYDPSFVVAPPTNLSEDELAGLELEFGGELTVGPQSPFGVSTGIASSSYSPPSSQASSGPGGFDVAITNFAAASGNWSVSYNVVVAAASSLTMKFYSSVDGSTLGNC